MATYKGIQGYSVQKLSSDPTASEAVGQLWYNSTAGKFKISVEGAGAWATGGALNTNRSRISGCGTATSGLAIAGVNGGPQMAVVEKYDGSTWTEIADVNTAREAGGSSRNSPSANTLYFAGNSTANSESWNDTSWSATPALNTARSGVGGAGNSSTSALCFAGEHPPTAVTEKFDGSAWTTVNSMNTARAYLAGTGIVTAALAIGGDYAPAQVANVEKYDGTSWTELTGNLNTVRSSNAAAGTTALAITMGGYNAASTYLTICETWNGTSWSAQANMAIAKGSTPDGFGTSTAAVCSGGGNPAYTPTKLDFTEEWTDPVYTVKTVTVS